MGEARLSGVRFAPSPTGTFHLGNLRTAWVSWRWAQALGEPWVVRFEDIDRPRVVEGAQAAQLADLAQLGLVPSRMERQTDHHGFHRAELERAAHEGMAYPCSCSRREVQAALETPARSGRGGSDKIETPARSGRGGSDKIETPARSGRGGSDEVEASASAPHAPVAAYTGKCRPATPVPQRLTPGTAWRFRSPDPARDAIVGRVLGTGEFIPAYPWACALDDLKDYRLLVRAYDLEAALEVQREIQAWARGPGFTPPAVFHTSLVVQDDGHRLEKRTRGVTLAEWKSSGKTVADLLARFAESLSLNVADLRPGRVFGEGARQKTLSELGIRVKLG